MQRRKKSRKKEHQDRREACHFLAANGRFRCPKCRGMNKQPRCVVCEVREAVAASKRQGDCLA